MNYHDSEISIATSFQEEFQLPLVKGCYIELASSMFMLLLYYDSLSQLLSSSRRIIHCVSSVLLIMQGFVVYQAYPRVVLTFLLVLKLALWLLHC